MDLAPYLARLALLLPLLCAIIIGALLLAKKYLGVGVDGRNGRAPDVARVTQTLLLGPGARLAVVEFADRRLLLALGKGGITTLADAPLLATPAVVATADLLDPTPFSLVLDATRTGATSFAAIRAVASRLGRAANAR